MRSRPFNWMVRVACGAAAAATGLAITRALYPMLHHKESLFAELMSALICPLWGLTLVAQPLLGWWPNEDDPTGVDLLSPRWRVLLVLGGLFAIALTATFVAYVGESDPGP